MKNYFADNGIVGVRILVAPEVFFGHLCSACLRSLGPLNQSTTLADCAVVCHTCIYRFEELKIYNSPSLSSIQPVLLMQLSMTLCLNEYTVIVAIAVSLFLGLVVHCVYHCSWADYEAMYNYEIL